MEPSCLASLPLFAEPASAEMDLAAFRALADSDITAYHARVGGLRADLVPSGQSPIVRRLKATDGGGASFLKKLRCLVPQMPISKLERRHSFDSDLLALKLRRGRACEAHQLCTRDRCGIDVRDQVLTAEEAAALAAHGQEVLDAEGSSARDDGWPYVRVEFMRSAHNGSRAGHILMMRVAERLRRVAAEVFRLPMHRVGHAETLLALRRTPESGAVVEERNRARGLHSFATEEETVYHVDEALSSTFHFSSVVWLGEQGRDFEGGEIAFLHNHTVPWLIIEPAIGRTAFFSSGWENVHGVKPVTAGQRWALSMVFMVHDELQEVPAPSGRRFRESCVVPANKSFYPICRDEWAAAMVDADSHRAVGAAAGPGGEAGNAGDKVAAASPQ